jgi:hypothetical protein
VLVSAEAVGWVYRYSPYEGATFAVHLAVADSVNDQGDYEFWMRQNRCAEKARLGRQTVNTALRQLVDDGFLALVKVTPGGANRYLFLMPDVPQKLSFAPRKVSPQTTPTPQLGVAVDDTPVVAEDTRVSPTTTTVSSQTTGGVVYGDTEPKRTQEQPNTSSSFPALPSSEEEVALLIFEAVSILANDHLERRQGAPVQAVDRWMAATRAGLRREHEQQARHLIATEPGHTPASLAAALEPQADTSADPLEKTARAARALQERDRSCAECAGGGMRLLADGTAARCDHTGEAA